jgi:uncharacterized protein DUF3658/uncharacterized protein DUF1835
MSEATLHVVFSDSAARLLRPALRKVDPWGRVLAFPDDLGFGPINPPDPQARLAWMKQQLRVPAEDWDRLPAKTNAFWSIALAPRGRIVVWASRRTVMEYAGFLEWIWRLGEHPYRVVDLTDVETEWQMPDGTVRTGRVTSLGLLEPDQIEIDRFLGRARALSVSWLDRYHGMWRQLREENSALRIIRDDRLQSVPLTHFDQLLLSCLPAQWLTVSRVVGQALVEAWDDDGIQTSDIVLAGRTRALMEAGQLEYHGDLADWLQCEVRLPQGRG